MLQNNEKFLFFSNEELFTLRKIKQANFFSTALFHCSSYKYKMTTKFVLVKKFGNVAHLFETGIS